jgi:hypothetical protein
MAVPSPTPIVTLSSWICECKDMTHTMGGSNVDSVPERIRFQNGKLEPIQIASRAKLYLQQRIESVQDDEPGVLSLLLQSQRRKEAVYDSRLRAEHHPTEYTV